MSDREIAVATKRWSNAKARRIEIGAVKRRADAAYRANLSIWSPLYVAAMDTSSKLAAARHNEATALRALAKLCATTHRLEVEDATVVEPLLTLESADTRRSKALQGGSADFAYGV